MLVRRATFIEGLEIIGALASCLSKRFSTSAILLIWIDLKQRRSETFGLYSMSATLTSLMPNESQRCDVSQKWITGIQ